MVVTVLLQKLEYLKNNYQILTVKLLILALFGWTLYLGFNGLYSRWNYEFVTSDTKTLMQNSQFLNSIKLFFRPAFLVLMPTIGIFINKQIGWFLITSFIYFVISSIAFKLMGSKSTDLIVLGMGLIFIVLFILLILVMNKEKIRNGIYNIPKTDLLMKNIIASIIGMGITIVVAYLKK